MVSSSRSAICVQHGGRSILQQLLFLGVKALGVIWEDADAVLYVKLQASSCAALSLEWLFGVCSGVVKLFAVGAGHNGVVVS